MGDFKKFDKGQRGGFGGGGFGGGKPFGGKKFGGGPRPMFQATCSQCGQSCEVPFKPTGERPVYCSNCFKNQAGPDARFSGKPSFDRGPRPQFGGPKPSFGGGGTTQVQSAIGGVSKVQFESLNAKLDKILLMLGGAKMPKAAEAPIAFVPEVKVKKIEAKKEKKAAKKAKAKKK